MRLNGGAPLMAEVRPKSGPWWVAAPDRDFFAKINVLWPFLRVGCYACRKGGGLSEGFGLASGTFNLPRGVAKPHGAVKRDQGDAV